MREFDIIIYVYNILIFPKVDFGIFYKAALTFYIIVNILFLNMLKNNRYNRLIYFLYIMINISLTIFGYSEIFTIIMYVFETGNYSDILDIFIGNNFFTHIIFFLEVLFPISYFRVNNPMLKK